ncbi:MAG TPA: hypothetical protein VH540_27160 [Ktedonobacterales bacterium]|jgi:hypothetical protein
MNVRKRFWVVFGGAVLLALLLPFLPFAPFHQATGSLHVQVYRESATAPDNTVSMESPPTLWVQLTDADGRLIDNADLQTVANMTTMDMGQLHFTPQRVGRGLYKLSLFFTMPGSWLVRLDAQAPQYEKTSQQLSFWVQAFQNRVVLSEPGMNDAQKT